MATFHGVNMSWGVPSGSICTAFGTCVVQTATSTNTGDLFELRNETGDQVAVTGYGIKREATFTYYSSTAGTAGLAAITKPSYCDMVTLSGDTARPFLTGSMLVKDVTVDMSNTDAARVTVNGTFYPLITS